ncbi:MAG: PilZ domain-containing protein [Jannaschia sp.]
MLKRRVLRQPTDAKIILRFEEIVTTVRLLDISEHGAKVGAIRSQPVGRIVTLIAPDITVEAEVRWTREDKIGLRFFEKLAEDAQQRLSSRPWAS